MDNRGANMSKPHRKMQSLILPAATCFLLLSLQAVPTPAQPNSLVLAGERLFVLCGDPVRLFEVSAFDGRVLKELPVPAGFQPTGAGGLALNRLELFLTSGGGQIYTIDSRDGHLIRTLDIFDPVEVNFLEVSGLAHVPGQGLLVSSSTPVLPSVYLSPDDGSFRRRLPGAQRLHGLGAGPLSRLFAWNTAENGIEEVDEISGDRVAFTAGDTIFAEGATGLAYSGRHLFLSGAGNDVIKIVDPRANTVVRAFPAPRTPVYGLASAPEEPSIVFLRSDRFPFFLSGAFRERSGVIEKGEVFVYPEGADPALADRVFSFDYPGEFSSEVFSASLEEADFPSDRGVFTFYGIGTGIDGATTPLQEALTHTVTVVLDSLPPFAQIGEPASGSVLTPNDYRDGTTAFSVIGWVTDTPAGLRGVEFLVQRADWTDPRVAGFMNLNGQPSALVDFIWDPQQDGDYEIWLHAMDRSGNEGASVRHSVSVDRNPIPTPIPGIPIPTDAEILFASPPLEVFSTVAMAELDGDLDPELVFGTDKTGGEDTGAGLYAINLDGSTVAGLWPILLDVDVRSSPAVADLDGDGLDEVVVGTYGPPSTILIFDNDGSPMGSADSRLSVISSPAIGNLDDDPALEIVVGTSDGTLLALESDGTPLNPAWPVELPRRQPPYLVDRNDVDSSPALGDLDGDGVPEIVALSDDGVVYAYHADGTPVAGFPFAAPRETFHHPVLTSSNSASPILADVEGDGRIDVVAALSNGRVYALSGDGTMLNGFPLRFPPTAPADTPAEEGDEILSTPAVGDVDGDGLLELAVAFYSGQADESRLYVYDLTGPAHGPAMAWPMFQHDGPRKGFFPNAPGGDANHDGNVDDRDNSAFVLSWYRHATMPRFQPAFDFDWSRRIDGFDLNAYLGIQQGHPAPPFVPPTLPSTATATPTGATGEPVVDSDCHGNSNSATRDHGDIYKHSRCGTDTDRDSHAPTR